MSTNMSNHGKLATQDSTSALWGGGFMLLVSFTLSTSFLTSFYPPKPLTAMMNYKQSITVDSPALTAMMNYEQSITMDSPALTTSVWTQMFT